MAHAEFVHLRVHSAYSLSEGAIKVKELVSLCQKHRMPAAAITDSGNLFGALEFSLAARDAGVQPIIGCQLAIAREDGSAGGNGSGLGPAIRRHPDQLVVPTSRALNEYVILAFFSHKVLNYSVFCQILRRLDATSENGLDQIASR